MGGSIVSDDVDTAGPCEGSGHYVPFGWSWYPCPDCGAAVYRGELGLVDHRPGERGEMPDRENDGYPQD